MGNEMFYVTQGAKLLYFQFSKTPKNTVENPVKNKAKATDRLSTSILEAWKSLVGHPLFRDVWETK